MKAKPFRIGGRHVLWSMLAFFGAVIAVNVGFIVLAVQSFPGEDVRRSYVQGLNYNETLAERRAQAALDWSATAALIQQDSSPAVEIVLRDSGGRPIDGLTTTGELRWPTNARFDHRLVFTPRGEGRYVARLDGLAPGRWVLRGHARQSGSRALDFEAELTWPSSR
jgi:nitrogen fixation protein FixH